MDLIFLTVYLHVKELNHLKSVYIQIKNQNVNVKSKYVFIRCEITMIADHRCNPMASWKNQLTSVSQISSKMSPGRK